MHVGREGRVKDEQGQHGEGHVAREVAGRGEQGRDLQQRDEPGPDPEAVRDVGGHQVTLGDDGLEGVVVEELGRVAAQQQADAEHRERPHVADERDAEVRHRDGGHRCGPREAEGRERDLDTGRRDLDGEAIPISAAFRPPSSPALMASAAATPGATLLRP